MKILVCKHVPHEGLGYFEQLLKSEGIDYEYQELYQDSEPRDLKKYDGLVIMGGPMNAYQENQYPFLKTDFHYIETALKLELPQLGFCLGAQLFARFLGAKVYRNELPELGWYALQLEQDQGNSTLFSGFPDLFHAFQWHEDTFEMPVDCARLASSSRCKNQAFSFQDKLVGLQFHLEIDSQMIREWLTSQSTAREWGFEIEPILQDTQKYISQSRMLGKRLFRNFFGKFK